MNTEYERSLPIRGVEFADLAFGEVSGVILLVFGCLAITATLAIYAAIKNSKRFWYCFGALAIATLLAALGYWQRSALFEANIQDHNMISSGGMPTPGSAYLGHLNFILQSMIGVFMMIIALVIRRTRSLFQPS